MITSEKNSPQFITIRGIAERWNSCSDETVKRAARREGWIPYRINGRIVRYRLSDVLAYEERCAGRPPSYRITPPARSTSGCPGT
jgi:hypothetical protein